MILTNDELADALDQIVISEAYNGYALLVAINHQALDEWDRNTIRKFQFERDKCDYKDNSRLEILADKIRAHNWN
jgi:hypothetical protein